MNDTTIDEMCQFLEFKPGTNDLTTQSKKIIQYIQNDNSIDQSQKDIFKTYVYDYTKKIADYFSINLPKDLFNDRNPLPASHIEYEQGTINPLKKRHIKRRLMIHTKFRENYNYSKSTDYILSLPFPLKHIVSLKLTSIEIKNAYYNISKFYNNDTFLIKTYDFSNNEQQNVEEIAIQLERGFYDENTLADHLNNVIFTEQNNLNLIQCYYDILLGKFVFKRDFEEVPEDDEENPVKRFEIRFIPEQKECDEEEFREKSLGWLMGFTKQDYTWDEDYINIENAQEQRVPTGYVSDINAQFEMNYLLLNINEFNHHYIEPIIIPFYNHTMNKSQHTIAKIQLPKTRQTMINLIDTGHIFLKREYTGPVEIDKLQIQLTDEYGRIVDLNGLDYSFTLELEQLYTI